MPFDADEIVVAPPWRGIHGGHRDPHAVTRTAQPLADPRAAQATRT